MDFNNINKLYLGLLVMVIIAGGYYTYQIAPQAWENYQKDANATLSLDTAKQELETLKAEKQQREQAEKFARESGKLEKVIYQTQGISFGADASFAPLFEAMIDHARTSGIRIRSIDYNYAPADDIIFTAQLPGYNVCELNITAVGTYAQFQAFYKNIFREHYLINIAELEIKPWENDKSILITNMKLRLYTKSS